MVVIAAGKLLCNVFWNCFILLTTALHHLFIDDRGDDTNSSAKSPLLSLNSSSRKPNHLTDFFKAHKTPSSPGLLRQRNLQHERAALPGRHADISLFDTASIYSSPSMLYHLDVDVEDQRSSKGEDILRDKIEVNMFRQCVKFHDNAFSKGATYFCGHSRGKGARYHLHQNLLSLFQSWWQCIAGYCCMCKSGLGRGKWGSPYL